jgi:hypothetical protein
MKKFIVGALAAIALVTVGALGLMKLLFDLAVSVRDLHHVRRTLEHIAWSSVGI